MEQDSRVVKHFYVIYSTDTLMPISITSVEPSLEEGLSYGEIDYSTGEDFINFKKILHNYCVIIEDGRTTFRPINILSQVNRIKDVGNIVLDLDPKTLFFEIIGVVYSYRNRKIKLMIDVDGIDIDVRLYLKNTIRQDKLYSLWVTEVGDPTALITETKFNLYKLIRDQQLEIEIDCDKDKISLWATK